MGPVELFEAAASHAIGLAENVRADQLADPTPCAEWDVRALLEHLRGGPAYLLAAMGQDVDPDASYRAAVEKCLTVMRDQGALEQRCISPLGFEWSVGEAAAGTFMDQLVHSWDLAVATGQDRALDPALVDACVAMFLPDMPERGRAGGLVGPAVMVAEDASAQDRLLGAMGRTP